LPKKTLFPLPLACLAALLLGSSPAFAVSMSTDIEDAPLNGATGLSHSNGNKIVAGAFNLLHAVYEDGYSGVIFYLTGSADPGAPNGVSWIGPAVIAPWGNEARYPSIAVDGSGNVGVVWVSNLGADGLGTVHYAFRTAGSPVDSWTLRVLMGAGTEPAIVGRGNQMHVTWTTYDTVRYASFPTTSPPLVPLTASEILAFSNCAGTRLHKPSITLMQQRCKPPVPRIAFLYARNEQTSTGLCNSPDTVVGPHVYQRNNPNPTWSLVYDGTRSDDTQGTSEPITVSISNNYSNGHTFLAWSDEQNGAARTMLAHGDGSVWTEHLFESARRHVHVRAGSVPPTQFRLAWTGGGYSDEFFSWDTYYDTATWTGAAPVFTGATHLTDIGEGGWAGRPQAMFWRRCQAGAQTTLDAFFLADRACVSGPALHVQTTHQSSCPSQGFATAAYLCQRKVRLVSGTILVGGVLGTTFETSDLGPIVKAGAASVEISVGDGKVVTVSWKTGRLVGSSDESFTITAPLSDVRVTGDVEVLIDDVGHLKEYDALRTAKSVQKCG
jgi:hypothetical protein